MADEFEQYKVPPKARFKIFQWGLGGMSATASILLVMLLRCYNGRDVAKDELWNARLNDLKQQMEQRIQKSDRQIAPQVQEVQTGIDSLTRQLDSLKKL